MEKKRSFKGIAGRCPTQEGSWKEIHYNQAIWGLLLRQPALKGIQVFFSELMMELNLEVCYKYG